MTGNTDNGAAAADTDMTAQQHAQAIAADPPHFSDDVVRAALPEGDPDDAVPGADAVDALYRIAAQIERMAGGRTGYTEAMLACETWTLEGVAAMMVTFGRLIADFTDMTPTDLRKIGDALTARG